MHPAASPFARSAVAPPYAPDDRDVFFAPPNLPFGRFHDRNELREWYHQDSRQTLDERDTRYRKGDPHTLHPKGGVRDRAAQRPMADTRWGDVLDVLVTDREGRWLSSLKTGYQVLVWANTSTSAAAREAMTAYAAQGGTVVAAVGALGPADASLTGVRPSGALRAVRAWKWSAGEAHSERGSQDAELGHFLSAEVEMTAPPASLEVLAVSVPEKLPLVVRHQIGRGYVYTCLVPWLGADGLAPVALRLLDEVRARKPEPGRKHELTNRLRAPEPMSRWCRASSPSTSLMESRHCTGRAPSSCKAPAGLLLSPIMQTRPGWARCRCASAISTTQGPAQSLWRAHAVACKSSAKICGRATTSRAPLRLSQTRVATMRSSSTSPSHRMQWRSSRPLANECY